MLTLAYPLNKMFKMSFKLFKTGLNGLFLFAVLMGLLLPFKISAKTKSADTIATGLQFTPIATSADSAIIIKKHQDNISKQAIPGNSKNKRTAVNISQPGDEHKSLWSIFFTGIISGLTAVVMPCIYPLLPLTVSFFLKLAKNRRKAVLMSMAYGLCIIGIYVSLGLILAILFGPDALNRLATNGVFNLVVFAMLTIFAISFLGAYEITLPSSLVNKVDTLSDKGGLVGIFFMALTLVVVSFSCTGGVVAADLAAAFSKGELLSPAISMLGFSLALALPFVIFSLFPSALKSLPKSGGWLNSVKVVLGFLELAFALKFLSNVDLAYHWNWLDREIFLSIWISIGVLIILYLLGSIKFSHDSLLTSMSVPRVFISLFFIAFTIYMIPGLWGAPLRSISAFLPPPATQDFNLYNLQLTGVNTGQALKGDLSTLGSKKYESIFIRGKVAGIEGWYDYDQALAVSKATHKPVLIDFTGWNCVNCRKMENNVWSNPEVLKRMQQNFVIAELYIDDKTELSPAEQFKSLYSGKKITTLGAKWSDFQASRFNSNSQPDYVIVNSKGDELLPPRGADYNPAKFVEFLDAGIAAYKNNNGSN
jgi:thiol:disulfide interchange protein